MRKIFLDCGGNLGRAVRAFFKVFPDATEYEVFSFEPQVRLNKFYKGLLNERVRLINKAVWTHDGEIDFHFTANVKGSTLFLDKAKDEGHVKTVTVPCIDLSTWIARKFDRRDLILLKMNIEGAEYPILERMLAERTIAYVDDLYVSPHVQKVKGVTKHRHRALVQDLERAGVPMKWPPPWGHVRPKEYPFDQIEDP